jgi:predicted metal-dependent hydrolase
MQPHLPFEAPLDVYYVRHRRARRYLLRVDHDGRVRVTIPRGGSRRDASRFAAGHLDWIHRQLARVHRGAAGIPERLALRRQAAQELPRRLTVRAASLGLSVSRVSVRDQRTRWGSCGPNGHITLNWRLLLMPEWVCDYVLVHELMHLRRRDHSAAFWALVAAAVPRYQDARAWLRVNGPALH